MRSLCSLSLALFSLALASCATGTSAQGPGSGGTGATGAGPTSGGSGGTGGFGGGFTGGSSGGEPAPKIYVHTNTTLYEADPSAPDLAVKEIGPVDCIGGAGEDTSLTDLAVSATGDIWGISKSNVFRLEIDGTSVKCTQTIALNNPADIRFYGLTFAPKGVLDPSAEILIAGNTAGELWSVSAGGELVQRGTLGTVPLDDGNGHSYPYSGKKWELSGDLVFLENGGNPAGFATVRDCPNPPSSAGCHVVDTLIELDVPSLATAGTGSVLKSVRGQIVPAAECDDGSEGYGSVFGVTAYKDKVYGFARGLNIAGLALSMDNNKGTACIIKSFTQEWSGAGITTTAEVDIPPPK